MRLLLSFLTVTLLAALALPAAAAPNQRPNILFILADDHRADGIGALGSPQLKTPTLDKLVERGVSFSRAYIMGSMEGAVCCPSRCMVQTGRSLFHLPPTNLRKSYADFAAAMKDKAEGRDWSLLPRLLHERQVSVVQESHGRHKADALSLAPQRCRQGPHLGDGRDGPHQALPPGITNRSRMMRMNRGVYRRS